nr:hypothetical protein [uncultured Deefgea sp.]
MAEIIFFQARSALDAKQNLNNFIEHCRSELTLYEDQGGFGVDKWHYTSDGRAIAMTFSKYNEQNDPYNFEPMDEPFIFFAKAYIRYTQSEKQVKSVGNRMVVLRLLHDALIEIHGKADVLKTDGLVQQKVRDLADARYKGSAVLYRYGQALQLLYEFLQKKFITPSLPEWSNPWQRQKSKAEQTDKASREWQEERCPSFHHMLSIADCFARAETNEDKYWSSVFILLMFAPSRAGEILLLSIDCLHHAENGHLGVRWFGEKGFGHTIKWVPSEMKEAVIEAHRRLMEIGEPARAAAKFAHDKPGVFYRHENCITPEGFPENKPLDALEFGMAMNYADETISRLKAKVSNFNNITAWNTLGAHSSQWIKKLREHGNPTYEELAKHTYSEYKTQDWPHLPSTEVPVWKSLLLVRDREFHTDFQPRAFSWVLPDVNQINWQLAPREGMKNPTKTLFQRFVNSR